MNEDCANRIQIALDDQESSSFKTCDCLPDCNSIEYRLEVVLTRMSRIYFPSDFNSSIPRLLRSESFVYFGGDEFVAYKRSMNYGFVVMLSNVGGLLGLFLGISVLSVIETIYFFTVRFINNLWLNPSK